MSLVRFDRAGSGSVTAVTGYYCYLKSESATQKLYACIEEKCPARMMSDHADSHFKNTEGHIHPRNYKLAFVFIIEKSISNSCLTNPSRPIKDVISRAFDGLVLHICYSSFNLFQQDMCKLKLK